MPEEVQDVFKKKSKHGMSTPRPDRALIQTRFQVAEQHYRKTYGSQRKTH